MNSDASTPDDGETASVSPERRDRRRDDRPTGHDDVDRPPIDVLDDSVVGTFVLDASFRVVWANRTVATFFGIDREALLGADKRELIEHEIKHIFEDADGFAERVLASYDDNAHVDVFECHVVASDDRADRWLEHRSLPIASGPYAGGRLEHYTDVTAQKQRERRFEAIFNSTYQFIGLMEPDGTLVEVNEAALAFSGLDREAVVGKPLWEAPSWQVDDETPRELQAAVERAAAGEFVRYDVDVRGTDGTATIDFSIRPVTDDAGDVVLLVPEGRDISELKRREQELRQSREFLRQIQAVADIGGWEIDLRTDSLKWTDEVYRIHDLPPDYEPTVEDALSFYHPDDRPEIAEAVELLVDGGYPFDLQLRLVTATGETRWVRALGSPWYEGDELVGARGTFQDITEWREQRRTLERQNRRFEEFASVVSHDLRNPLMVAHGSLELARTTGDDAHFDRAESALDRMGSLINDLLALAREGRRVEGTTTLELATVVEDVCETLPLDGATVDVSLGEYSLDADERRLRQLLENLLSNAIRHGGDDVTVRVGVLDDETGFFVADDGPGIPPEVRTSVFDRGYTTSPDGLGFGLAIVESIVAAHGWNVDLTESETGGARFEILVS
ncbi:PAS domain-containing sensor histidine kinase [Halogeometricum limi]|uniref:histidine kinase n=1 Tax=Halogeometricum limi TaxID=555875 RepID=A0A1I6FVR0_9EURY|nr:PAS domain-containing protein [Halogeometricum limi]SFR33897.1 PAS domain S-box-containing protein [Halogeometricum limi]